MRLKNKSFSKNIFSFSSVQEMMFLKSYVNLMAVKKLFILAIQKR